MIDWLTRDPKEEPTLAVSGQDLPIVIRRHATAKRMILRLSADGQEIRVTIPKWGRTADAMDFARSRQDWICRQLETHSPNEPLRCGAAISYQGESLTICHDPNRPRRPARDGTVIVVGGPEASLGNRLKRWLESEAREHMTADLADYCAVAGKTPPRLSLSNAKRRWGSCAPDGSIRINWRLIMAPGFVRRSVVAHEVTHLIHFNHSRRFHALLADIYDGDIARADQWLKREGRSLYLTFG
ncbi:MAG: M48 family metallopeptidase [Sphingomonadaceae bacterium]|nr:M48 family metallopeptidase [Sphingomonadaceae bacterium]